MYARPRRSLNAALRAKEFAVIAEVKKASPSKGLMRTEFDPVRIGTQYQRGGASAVSVLTDEKFFGGRLEYLSELRSAIDLPLLRKDFIIHDYQLHEARSAGADAVLLIVGSMDHHTLMELHTGAVELGLEVLVEVHNGKELRTAVELGARMIGVNNRDLGTLETRLETSYRLGPELPPDCLGVSESGITSGEDLVKLTRAGFGAALIGEFLMTQENPGTALRVLLDDYEGLRRDF
jgi:indole-3-glycerol phosphate synthase